MTDTDDIQGAQTVEGEQPSTPPIENEKPIEPSPEEAEEKEALESSKNPERTKSYIDRLKRELAEERASKAQSTEPLPTSVFDSFRQPEVPQFPEQHFTNLNQTQVDSITTQFVDQQGNVDINGLNKALTDANRRASAAEQRVGQVEQRYAKFEESQQLRDAYVVHPEINPIDENGRKNPKFDPELFRIVSERMAVNWSRGVNATVLQVANEVRRTYTPPKSVNVEAVKKQAVEDYKQTQANRNQGPIESGNGGKRDSVSSDDLRARSRKEKLMDTGASAITERLIKAGVIKR